MGKRSKPMHRRPDTNRADPLSRTIFEHCPEGVYLVGEEGVLRGFNRAMERITGWSREEVIGKDCMVLFRCKHDDGSLVCRSDCAGRLALNDPDRPRHTEICIRTKSGHEIVVTASYGFLPAESLPGVDGSASSRGYALGVMREITERKREENLFKTQAITDGLTGLFNFRFFQQQLAVEIHRADRYHHPLSISMLDIDHFKFYNDLHGHPQGNEVLKQLAQLIQHNTRKVNTVARYGGEEFVILLPETPKEVAVEAAERLCSIIEDTVFPYQDQQPEGNLTASMGVASYPEDAHDADWLVRSVDEFLYQAKREGRNRVRWRKSMPEVR